MWTAHMILLTTLRAAAVQVSPTERTMSSRLVATESSYKAESHEQLQTPLHQQMTPDDTKQSREKTVLIAELQGTRSLQYSSNLFLSTSASPVLL